MSTFVVGIDGGGTRTQAVALGLEGQLLGRSIGRAALLDASNADAVARAVHQAAEAAAAEAGLTLPAAAVFAGIAGAGRPEVARPLQTALEGARLGDRVQVGTDVQAAAQDALGGGPGIVLLSGTGSIAWGRSVGGRELRVGGWGRHLGDEGSGYALGLQGLREVVRAADGRAGPTSLTSALLEATGTTDPTGLITWIQQASKSQIAALAPVIGACAETDPTAQGVLARAATDLAQLATALANRLSAGGEPVGTVVLAGGLLASGGPLRVAVRDLLVAADLSVSEAHVDGARGAGQLALTLMERPVA